MATPTVWLHAARPRTLPAAVAPVIIGTAMAYDAGGLHLASAIACLLGAAFIQIGTNFANDYYDFIKGADTPERTGPTRATAAGLVSPGAMRRAMVVAFALVFIPGAYILYRGGWPYLMIGLASILCGVLYTGGPYPLGYLGLGDLFVLIFFGPVAVAGTYFLQTFALPPEVIVAGFMPGLFSTAILTVNNLRDIDGDRKAGKRTLAVRFGPQFARIEYAAAVILGGLAIPIALCVLTRGHYFALAACAIVVAAMPQIRSVWKQSGAVLNPVLANTGKLLLAFSVLFSIGWIIPA